MASVELVFDSWGIPEITAPDPEGLAFGLGYAHAADRLFQLESHRLAAAGRLAELLGPAALDADRFLRRLGLAARARRDWETQPPDAARLLRAYAAGVNARLEEGGAAAVPEFWLLNYEPVPWHPVDSLAVGRLIGWMLGVNWETELTRLELVRRLGPDRAARFEPLIPPDAYSYAPDRAQDSAAVRAQVLAACARLAAILPLGAASNAWAVGPDRSASGGPLLAADPHLRPQLPVLWYLVRLRTPEFWAAGASIPGLFGLSIGRNRHCAWGVTVAFADTQDLFIEEIRPGPAGELLTRTADGWEPVRSRVETFRAGGSVRREVCRETRRGPLILDDPPYGLSLAASALRAPVDGSLLYRLLVARNCADIEAVVLGWTMPALNFIVADAAGNIAYFMAGRVPVRRGQTGIVPAPAWDPGAAWHGWVEPERMPRLVNPPSGFVFSANEFPALAATGEYLGIDWPDPYRAARIHALLDGRQRHSAQDFIAYQQDLVSIPLSRLRDYAVQAAAGLPDRVRRLLVEWDGTVRADSAAAGFLEVLRVELFRVYLKAQGLNLTTTNLLLGQGLHPFAPVNGFAGRLSSFLLTGLAQGIFDAVVDEAVRRTLTFWERRAGRDPAKWRWGRVHRLRFTHPLGALPGFGRLWRGPDRPVGGDFDTVAQASFLPPAAFEKTGWVANYRQVIDLAEPEDGYWVINTGQGGNPFSRHYLDQFRVWYRGQYLRMAPGRAVRRLRLDFRPP